ncbi:MAG: ligase-associated DNA damage response endonuclease PdeM [Pseudomonadota bacterium]
MSAYDFTFQGAELQLHPSGCLTWAAERLLVVSDLHLGKALRMARRNSVLLPPYETTDTLARLADEIAGFNPQRVICLGDSFDDLRAMDELSDEDSSQIAAMMAGRDWIWIEGNHDAGPVHIGGTHRAEVTMGSITFRHIADYDKSAEISGHFHPKAQLAGRSSPCFLIDRSRIIMPAFGTYTGGLRLNAPVLRDLMSEGALAITTGSKTRAFPAYA